MKLRLIALALFSLATAAHAEVKVNFVNPDKFSDIRDNWGFSQKEVLKDIEAYLVAQVDKRLPGRDVSINVTDVNLAGEVEPVGRRAQWLRVMRSVTAPSMELNYEVREGDKVVVQGKAELRDMDYQHSFNTYSSGDPLRHEVHALIASFTRIPLATVEQMTPVGLSPNGGFNVQSVLDSYDFFVREGLLAQPLARCGYQDYAVVEKVFSLARPKGGGDIRA